MGYDAANRLTGRTDQPSCGGCATPAITTTLGYDADGAVVRVTRQEGALAWIIHEHFCLISSATSSCIFILLGR